MYTPNFNDVKTTISKLYFKHRVLCAEVGYELDDLLQEAWFAFNELTKKEGIETVGSFRNLLFHKVEQDLFNIYKTHRRNNVKEDVVYREDSESDEEHTKLKAIPVYTENYSLIERFALADINITKMIDAFVNHEQKQLKMKRKTLKTKIEKFLFA